MSDPAGPRVWPAAPSAADRAIGGVGAGLAAALALGLIAVAAALVGHGHQPSADELSLFGGTLIAAGLATLAAAPVAIGVAPTVRNVLR